MSFKLTQDEVRLLRQVHRWLRLGHGYFYRRRSGMAFGPYVQWRLSVPFGGMWMVTYHDNAEAADFTRNHGSWPSRPLHGTTVAECVDELVAIGMLPPQFSAAYRAGWDAAVGDGMPPQWVGKWTP